MRSQVEVRRLVSLIMLSCTAGCFSGGQLPGETGTVSGTASYKDQPVPAGSSIMMLHRERGILATGLTSGSGSFRINMRGDADVLVGEYDVYIKPPGELAETVGTPTKDNVPPAWNLIPARYWSEKTSQEVFVVQPGANTYQLVLED